MKTKDKIILIVSVFLSACVSITVMWWVWTGIFYLVERFK